MASHVTGVSIQTEFLVRRGAANMTQHWECSSRDACAQVFSLENHKLVTLRDFLGDPEFAIRSANLQRFAKITPQYPGIRAPLESEAQDVLLDELSPALSEWFEAKHGRWTMQAWYSIVTAQPRELLPIQRLPHVDGTDPNQIAMMLYLHRTEHGGTAFFRHKLTGLEALTDESFPIYREALQREVAEVGMPPASYVTDGSPLFERTYHTPGIFNEAVFYRGNILHSGMIENGSALSADPSQGRLTINAFLRPPQ